MPSGTDLIRQDHERVDALFEAFDASGDGAFVGQIIDALTAHDEAEHAALYPLVEALLDHPDLTARSEVAHMLVKRQIDVVKHLEGRPLVDAVQVLRALVAEHVADEEENILPAVEAAASVAELEGLASRIEQNKQRVG
jgi:hemerythrin superfamily protein